MATENTLTTFSLPAAADLSASQYRIVTVNASGQVALATANSTVVGVLQNKPLAGRAGTVAIGGVSKVIAGAAITAGARLTSDANGAAIAAAAAGDPIIGIALEGGSTGALISVVLQQYPFAALA